MDVILLRLVHIGAGAFWVGAVFTFFLFVQPTAAALGPDGQRFSFHLSRHARLPDVILGSGVLTVAAGLLLLWRSTSGFDLDVVGRHPALGFTIGGIAAIAALGVGSLYVYPRTRRIVRIVDAASAAGRPPTVDEQTTLMRTTAEARRAGWLVLTGLGVAVAAMATARYWGLVI